MGETRPGKGLALNTIYSMKGDLYLKQTAPPTPPPSSHPPPRWPSRRCCSSPWSPQTWKYEDFTNFINFLWSAIHQLWGIFELEHLTFAFFCARASEMVCGCQALCYPVKYPLTNYLYLVKGRWPNINQTRILENVLLKARRQIYSCHW